MSRFHVPQDLSPFVREALVRMRYLHPSIEVAADGDEIAWAQSLDNPTPDARPVDVERELTYLLYRAKIHAEGRPQRDALHRMAFGA